MSLIIVEKCILRGFKHWY